MKFVHWVLLSARQYTTNVIVYQLWIWMSYPQCSKLLKARLWLRVHPLCPCWCHWSCCWWRCSLLGVHTLLHLFPCSAHPTLVGFIISLQTKWHAFAAANISIEWSKNHHQCHHQSLLYWKSCFVCHTYYGQYLSSTLATTWGVDQALASIVCKIYVNKVIEKRIMPQK